MTEVQRSASSQWGSGWCIHGVAYGPLACNECAPGGAGMTVTGTVSTFRTTEAPVLTRADVDQIIRLLVSIEYQLRTRR